MSDHQSKSPSLNVFWDDGMLDHYTGEGVFDSGIDPGFLDVLEKHPENSDRLRNMLSILKRGPISPFISWHSSTPATVSQLLSFHTQEYINSLLEADKIGGKTICSGTFLNVGSWNAALLAAGATISAMKYILDHHAKICYSLARPPGHHAQPNQADGYCFLNNAGLAVQTALDSGCKRVAVIDIDVHYGNGTAEGFYRSDKVLTVSLHMNHGSWGLSHPQSGGVDEVGEGAGFGYNLNIPLPNGTGDKGYKYAMNEVVVPAVRKFDPDMMVFVVGQDSSAFDPNGRQCLTMEGYRDIGKIIRNLADDHSNGRILIVQEGGYHITYSAYCLHATLEGVLDLPNPLLDDPIAYYPEDDSFAVRAVDSIKHHHTQIVPFLRPSVVVEDVEEEELPIGRSRITWSPYENECLVKAWMERSEDNATDGEAFFKKVYSTFISLFGKDKKYRDFKSVGAHFRDLNKKIQLFQAIYNQIKGSDWSSGQNDADIQKRALEEYVVHNDGKTGFNLLSCWDVLKSHPKWLAIPPKALARRYMESTRSSKRSKTNSSSNPNTPSDANNIDFNDDPDEDAFNLVGNDDFVELPRPPGRRFKDKKGAGSSSAPVGEGENHVSSHVTTLIKEHITENRLTREQLRENNMVQEKFIQEMHERNKETKLQNMEKRVKHLRDKGLFQAADSLDAQLTNLILETYNLPK